MTKQDRAKMVSRLSKRFDYKTIGPEVCWEIETTVACEVDRAVRAERKAQRDTEELWASKRRRAEEQIVERAKGLGRKRP